MAKQIGRLVAGESVTLKFQTRGGSFEEPAEFLGMTDEGNAKFRTGGQDQAENPDDYYDWEAYRFQGRWCYGSSAQRLSLV